MTNSKIYKKVLILLLAILSHASFAESLLVTTLDTDSALRFDANTGAFIDEFASGGGLSSPHNMLFDANNNLYISSRGNDRVIRYDAVSGSYVDTFVSSGSGGLTNVHGLAIGPDGNLYVCSVDTDQILRYDGVTGEFIDIFATTADLAPYSLMFDGNGRLLVSSIGSNSGIYRFDETSGALIDLFASDPLLEAATGFKFGPDGDLYVANFFPDSVLRFDGVTGAFIDIFVQSASGNLNGPVDLLFGPDGNLYVTSFLGDAVNRYDGATGAFIDEFISFGVGGLGAPTFLQLAADPLPVAGAPPEISVVTGGPIVRINVAGGDYVDADGNVFVADQPYSAGSFGYTGDAGAAFFNNTIANTNNDALFQSMVGGSAYSYLFDGLTNGNYKVELFFAEPWWNSAGERLFDVSSEGLLEKSSYDAFNASGGQFIAITETFVSNVSDGQLNLAFTSIFRKAITSAIVVTSQTVDFGTVTIGNSQSQSITITNQGDGDLVISSLSSDNSLFTIEPLLFPLTIVPNASQTISLQFDPVDTNVAEGILQVASNDSTASPLNLTLTGVGYQAPVEEPDIAVSSTVVNWGNVAVGQTVQQSLNISNLGNQTLSISALALTGDPDFSLINLPASPFDILAGASQTITIEFVPTSVGAKTATIDISSNDPDESSVSISLSGDAVVQPAYRINAAGNNFIDINGNLFVADRAYTPGSFGYVGGFAPPPFDSTDVANTTDDLLYQALRGEDFLDYTFDNLVSGNYVVTLHFMDPFFSTANERLIDVTAEGSLVLDNYDMALASGGSYSASSQTFVVQVTDGQLNLSFVGVVRKALISAISVVLQ